MKKDEIKNKILERFEYVKKRYDISENWDDVPHADDTFYSVKINDGEDILVDPVTEFYLCKKYFLYFADTYGFILDPRNKKISPFKVLDFQEKHIIPSLIEDRFIIFRKCLTENNYVQTDKGYCSIKEVQTGDSITTLDKDGNKVWTEVLDSWKNNEKKEIIEFTLKNGSVHQSTLDHKWMTVDGWKEAKDLTIDDELITDFGDSKFGSYELPSDDHAKLIGYLMTDGRNGYEFINTNLKYIEEAKDSANNISGVKAWIRERGGSQLTKKQSYETRIIGEEKNKNPWLDFARSIGLDELSINRKFNKDLMNLNKRQMSILLNRLYAGDGWVTYGWRENPTGKKALKYSIGFITPNKDFIYQLQEILRQYGIHSYIKIRHAGRKRATIDTYLLYISGKKSALIFAKEIGVYDKLRPDFIEFLETNYKYDSNQKPNKIRKIKRIGFHHTYDITTKTSDFISNGTKVHNCRQVGISVITGIYAIWRINFNIAQDVLVVSKTKFDAQDYKSRAVVTYERLPAFLKTKSGSSNLTTLRLSNNSRLVARAQSPDSGRGMTPSLVILDEAAFMPYADEIWASVFPSLSNSRGQCFIVSTSNGLGNFYHKMWVEAEAHENDFTPIYIPWWFFPGRDAGWYKDIENKRISKLESIIETKQLDLLKQDHTEDQDYWDNLVRVFVEKKESEALSYEGPKENKPWLKMQKDNASSLRKFNQEILARFLGSGNTVLSTETLERISQYVRKPKYQHSLNGEDEDMRGLYIFQEPQDDINYTLVSDVSTGSGSDYSTMQVFRNDTIEQVAEYKNQVDNKLFAKQIRRVGKFFNNAYLIIETNQGLTVFNDLFLDEKEAYENMYFEFKGKAYRGFHTSPSNKKLMLDEFINNIENDKIQLYGSRTIEELKVYIWEKDKPQATKGYNDDLVLPLMILSYLLKYGNQNMPLLGFATYKQTVGMEGPTPTQQMIQEEIEFEKELRAKEDVKKIFKVEWEDYLWLAK